MPNKFEPAPEWGITSQTVHDRAIDWMFEELLGEPSQPNHKESK